MNRRVNAERYHVGCGFLILLENQQFATLGLPIDYQVVAKPILGGLHHVYALQRLAA
jgi:hypothetical protein